jgi:hypothetical protein
MCLMGLKVKEYIDNSVFHYYFLKGLIVMLLTKRRIQGGSNMTGTNCDLFTHK